MKDFVLIIKPGIIWGNLFAVVGGYMLGSHGHIEFKTFLGCIFGISFIIACAGVLNNLFDQDIDKLMERTRNRVLAKGLIRPGPALIGGTLLGIIGSLILALTTNFLTVTLALVGLFIYLVLYTMLLKRNSIHSTLIGGLSGAVPPVASYCAVTNRFDLPALFLVLAFCFWQVPHAYAIGILYFDDFTRAKIPLFPLIKSIRHSKITMLIYSVLFFMIAMLFPYYGYVKIFFAMTVGFITLIWIILITSGFWTKKDEIWASRVFWVSILVIVVFSLSLI